MKSELHTQNRRLKMQPMFTDPNTWERTALFVWFSEALSPTYKVYGWKITEEEAVLVQEGKRPACLRIIDTHEARSRWPHVTFGDPATSIMLLKFRDELSAPDASFEFPRAKKALFDNPVAYAQAIDFFCSATDLKKTYFGQPLDNTRACGMCEKIGDSVHDKRMKLCQSCRATWYCSKQCQRLQWPVHREVCKDIGERRKAVCGIKKSSRP